MVKRITCAESDALRSDLILVASCTDLDAWFHAESEIDTIWGLTDGTEVLKDVRYPNDEQPCRHYDLREEN